jgi:hypothetical protein
MKKYTVREVMDQFGDGAEVVHAREAGPDAAYVRMYQATMDRLQGAADRRAKDLAAKAVQLYQGLLNHPERLYADDFRGLAADAARIAQQRGSYEELREVEAITTVPED